jgi:MFS family permease
LELRVREGIDHRMADDPQPAPAGAVTARPSITAPFRHRIFAAIWVSALIANLGGLIQSVGASWLMLTLAHRPDMVALVQASITAPCMLFSLAAGAIADGADNRRVMIWAQTEMMLVSVALAVLGYLGLLTPWTLLSLTFLLGCGMALNSPAWNASIGEQVPRENLPSAVALTALGYNVARSVGPAIGGAIVAATSAAVAFAVNAVSYVALIVVLIRWRPKPRDRLLPREPLGTAMAAGLRYVAMSPAIGTVLFRVLTFTLAGSAIWALMPIVARDGVHGGPLAYGMLLGAFGVGAVAGAMATARLRHRLGSELMVRCSTIAFALSMAGVAAVSKLPLAMAVLFIGGGGWVLSMSTFSVTVNMSAPRWVVARAMALYQTVMFAGLAFGSWGWGHLATAHGLHATMLASAVATLVAILLGLRLPLSEPARLNLDPHSGMSEPIVGIDLEPRSGPVVTTIEYRIDPAKAAGFVAAMVERRRIRVRDGARDWMLLQDIADPALWTERFLSPTWVDYLRIRDRVTISDLESAAQVRAYCLEPPEIHHKLERPAGSMRNLLRRLRGEPAPPMPLPGQTMPPN